MYKTGKIEDILSANVYPGRGIIAGESLSGKYAVCAYFIMGRSENSRNRVLHLTGDELFTKPFDEAKVEDAKLIIYRAMCKTGNNLIITNGDHTDTICEAIGAGKTFSDALALRTFEPDAPNFTPRISAMLTFGNNGFKYVMSVIKSIDGRGSKPMRSYYEFEPLSGLGHFIHTYMEDGNPLPSFSAEPRRIEIPDSIDDFSDAVWNSLNNDNKISLYVRYTDIASLAVTERIFNKNER